MCVIAGLGCTADGGGWMGSNACLHGSDSVTMPTHSGEEAGDEVNKGTTKGLTFLSAASCWLGASCSSCTTAMLRNSQRWRGSRWSPRSTRYTGEGNTYRYRYRMQAQITGIDYRHRLQSLLGIKGPCERRGRQEGQGLLGARRAGAAGVRQSQLIGPPISLP